MAKEEIPPDSAETLELLQKAQANEPGAFDRLLERNRAYLRRLVDLRMDSHLRARVDPSDVVQEAQLEIFRRLPDFLERRPMPFRLWLRKTAHERLLMLWREHMEAARRSVGREVPLPDGSSALRTGAFQSSGPSPSRLIGQQELAQRVRQAVTQLPEADREVLLMRNYEGLSYQEVACILEIDAAAARKRHGRALVRLHQLLVEGGLTESQL